MNIFKKILPDTFCFFTLLWLCFNRFPINYLKSSYQVSLHDDSWLMHGAMKIINGEIVSGQSSPLCSWFYYLIINLFSDANLIDVYYICFQFLIIGIILSFYMALRTYNVSQYISLFVSIGIMITPALEYIHPRTMHYMILLLFI